MKINRIELSWFRGASEKATLDTGSKSVVVYGANGSGKSTFSDAIEFLVCGGKINHLSHEYSGKKQENAVPNTHKPADTDSVISIHFDEGNSIKANISPGGACSIVGEPEDFLKEVQNWEIEQFILRQDEVSAFIHDTKSQKYSVLLPLLGIENLEQAAENLHKLQQNLDKAILSPKNEVLKYLKQETEQYLSDHTMEGIQTVLEGLVKDYLEDKTLKEFQETMEKIEETIQVKTKSVEPEYKRYQHLSDIHKEDLLKKLNNLAEVRKKVKGKIDALLDSRVAVLEKASEFSQALDIKEEEIECPACGQSIIAEEFTKHVREELQSMNEIRVARDELKNAQKLLAFSLQKVEEIAKKEEIASWLDHSEQSDLKESIKQLKKIGLEKWEKGWSEGELTVMEGIIPSVVTKIESATKTAPPKIEKLINDQKIVEACKKALEINTINKEIDGIQNLIHLVRRCESVVRSDIRHKTEIIINEISSDIQSLWSKIHPSELIEEVELYLPEGTDKAIDVGLKFFGVEQPSPRLTLSEGHRNSLGLCIFMALAKLGGSKDRPIFLDDIISSFDREHRGMLVDVLLEDFVDSQIILLTHDRDWYNELRLRLPQANWKFKVLKPWKSPEIGLEWSESEYTFDDARTLIGVNTEAAGNRVRSIMDTNLAICAEYLHIPMPFLRGDRNDRRNCVELLQRIMSQANDSLTKKNNGSWELYSEPFEDWKEAITLLISWANPASHTGSLTDGEANRLIEVCEKTLDHFKCSNCNSYIWTADQSKKGRLQCECGVMRWKY